MEKTAWPGITDLNYSYPRGEVEGGGLQVQCQPGLQKEFSASTSNLVRPGAKVKDKKRDHIELGDRALT